MFRYVHKYIRKILDYLFTFTIWNLVALNQEGGIYNKHRIKLPLITFESLELVSFHFKYAETFFTPNKKYSAILAKFSKKFEQINHIELPQKTKLMCLY